MIFLFSLPGYKWRDRVYGFIKREPRNIQEIKMDLAARLDANRTFLYLDSPDPGARGLSRYWSADVYTNLDNPTLIRGGHEELGMSIDFSSEDEEGRSPVMIVPSRISRAKPRSPVRRAATIHGEPGVLGSLGVKYGWYTKGYEKSTVHGKFPVNQSNGLSAGDEDEKATFKEKLLNNQNNGWPTGGEDEEHTFKEKLRTNQNNSWPAGGEDGKPSFKERYVSNQNNDWLAGHEDEKSTFKEKIRTNQNNGWPSGDKDENPTFKGKVRTNQIDGLSAGDEDEKPTLKEQPRTNQNNGWPSGDENEKPTFKGMVRTKQIDGLPAGDEDEMPTLKEQPRTNQNNGWPAGSKDEGLSSTHRHLSHQKNDGPAFSEDGKPSFKERFPSNQNKGWPAGGEKNEKSTFNESLSINQTNRWRAGHEDAKSTYKPRHSTSQGDDRPAGEGDGAPRQSTLITDWAKVIKEYSSQQPNVQNTNQNNGNLEDNDDNTPDQSALSSGHEHNRHELENDSHQARQETISALIGGSGNMLSSDNGMSDAKSSRPASLLRNRSRPVSITGNGSLLGFFTGNGSRPASLTGQGAGTEELFMESEHDLFGKPDLPNNDYSLTGTGIPTETSSWANLDLIRGRSAFSLVHPPKDSDKQGIITTYNTGRGRAKSMQGKISASHPSLLKGPGAILDPNIATDDSGFEFSDLDTTPLIDRNTDDKPFASETSGKTPGIKPVSADERTKSDPEDELAMRSDQRSSMKSVSDISSLAGKGLMPIPGDIGKGYWLDEAGLDRSYYSLPTAKLQTDSDDESEDDQRSIRPASDGNRTKESIRFFVPKGHTDAVAFHHTAGYRKFKLICLAVYTSGTVFVIILMLAFICTA